jgi:hypothetical protein
MDKVVTRTAEEAAMTNNLFKIGSFLNQTSIELQRAERYRVFVTLMLFDLSLLGDLFGERRSEVLDSIVKLTQSSIRASDIISSIDGYIALLIPETPRQGAEVTSRRLSDLIRAKLSEISGREIDEIIPLEMVSFPDTAGAKTLPEFLKELTEKSRN